MKTPKQIQEEIDKLYAEAEVALRNQNNSSSKKQEKNQYKKSIAKAKELLLLKNYVELIQGNENAVKSQIEIAETQLKHIENKYKEWMEFYSSTEKITRANRKNPRRYFGERYEDEKIKKNLQALMYIVS